MTHQLAARFGGQDSHAGLPAMLLWGGLATCLSVVMAFASYQVWEQKFLAMKDHLAPNTPRDGSPTRNPVSQSA